MWRAKRREEPVLTIEHLSKSFGNRAAVNDISFTVNTGETLGLLGPNGAGKTTSLSLLSGLLQPDSGTVSFSGRPANAREDFFKFQVGLAPQDLALYEELTAQQNLELFGGLYGLAGAHFRERADDVLGLVGLADRREEVVKTFSGGMKRRLNIAGALLHDPPLLLLDEPTVGVDPQSRNAIFENLAELKSRGKTIVYTTHYMEEAERLCDRIVIIDRGRVIADDTVSGLYRRLPASQTLFLDVDAAVTDEVLARLRQLGGVRSATPTATGLRIDSQDFTSMIGAAVEIVTGVGLKVRSVRAGEASLEEAFIHLTGHALRDATAGPLP
jgi:ABC-2 type transport system ATP-binding protein